MADPTTTAPAADNNATEIESLRKQAGDWRAKYDQAVNPTSRDKMTIPTLESDVVLKLGKDGMSKYNNFMMDFAETTKMSQQAFTNAYERNAPAWIERQDKKTRTAMKTYFGGDEAKVKEARENARKVHGDEADSYSIKELGLFQKWMGKKEEATPSGADADTTEPAPAATGGDALTALKEGDISWSTTGDKSVLRVGRMEYKVDAGDIGGAWFEATQKHPNQQKELHAFMKKIKNEGDKK